MRAAVQDQVALSSLRPLELMAYLRAKGWKQESEIGDRGAVWALDHDLDVVLPARRELGDYALRVSEVLRTLARAEGRSELEILRDLQATTSDLLRIRVLHQQSEAGTLPLADAVKFVEQARDLMLASACAAIEKRPVYAKRKPQSAMDYLNHVHMGQTERGSFVLTVLSPVTPELKPVQGSLLPDSEPEDPYERRVTRTLMSSMYALDIAARDATLQSDMKPFEDAVKRGVSANLCDAVVGLSSISTGGDLDFQITWSRSRPVSGDMPGRVRFGEDAVHVIEEAARVFREVAPVEDCEVTGFVLASDRGVDDVEGDIRLDAFVEGYLRRVTIALGPKDYSVALRAHDQRRVVACVGDLIRQGRGYRLQSARHFRIVAAE
jgi:hypothetical protein